MALTANECASLLSLREYFALCAYFDLEIAAARSQMLASVGTCTLLPPIRQARFDVLSIDRTDSYLYVLCEGESGKRINLDCTPFMVKPQPKRTCKLERVA